MGVDVSKLAANSQTPGISTMANNPLIFSTGFSGTIPISGSINTTLPLSFVRTDVMSLLRVNVVGGSLGSLWFPVMGFAGLLDGSYYLLFTVTASSTGRVLNVEAINQTVGSTVTLPSLTITAVVDLYDYPF